jgi:hypothetical protein
MENTIKIEVNLNQMNIILAGLAKLPLEASLETFTIVRQQADAQIQQNRPEGPLADKVIN